MNSYRVLGVRIDDVTLDEAVAIIVKYVQSGEFHQVVTVNPEFIMTAQRHSEFRMVLEASDLALCDGANLVRAARWLGYPLRERVGGSDLTERLAERASECSWGLYFLGAGPGIAQAAADRLCARRNDVQVAGVWEGSPDVSQEAEIVARVNASGAELLFVAFGAPAQDLWIARNRTRLNVRMAMGVGGAFDYISGRVPRAPLWVQRAGFEWLYRLARQPWRWRRQLVLLDFMRSVAAEKRKGP